MRRALPLFASVLLLACSDEHPVEGALAELDAALAAGDAAALDELLEGEAAELAAYLPPGGDLASEGDARYGETTAHTPVRIPGHPRLVLEWRSTAQGWKVNVAATLEATRAAALNQALGGR